MRQKKYTVQERLAELMAEYHITQTDICNRVGIDKSTMSMYANGKRNMKQNKIAKISEAYHIDPTWLMGYDVPMHRTDFLDNISTDSMIDLVFDDETKQFITEYINLDKNKKKEMKRYLAYISALSDE